VHKESYVVHHQYGVGQYMGTITKEFDGIHRDFLHIVYRDNSNLYVPLEQFQLVRKFVSRDGVVPKLNRLGTNEWKKTKAKIKENVRDIADRLISLYSVREQDIAYQFAQDNPLQKEFEAEFEFELTHDQATAIKDIKADMQSTKPMDRLLCGDVGFGKTEVAIRAAFKAISEHKQVAFLCPTTVLSQQHFRTFSHRFENYPVKIAVLNRFVPDGHVKEILKEVEAGQIDVLIGTHRLLSKDVHFKDLALLIIDEEQRFGVEHKEKIKEVRQSIHVLSLSARILGNELTLL
jgi:transcription-repair coupling factor (superfamily II helicase)